MYLYFSRSSMLYSLLCNCLLLHQVTLVDEEGCVFIKWVDRTVSKVKPQELYKVDTEVRSSGLLNRSESFSTVLEMFSKSTESTVGVWKGLQV